MMSAHILSMIDGIMVSDRLDRRGVGEEEALCICILRRAVLVAGKLRRKGEMRCVTEVF